MGREQEITTQALIGTAALSLLGPLGAPLAPFLLGGIGRSEKRKLEKAKAQAKINAARELDRKRIAEGVYGRVIGGNLVVQPETYEVWKARCDKARIAGFNLERAGCLEYRPALSVTPIPTVTRSPSVPLSPPIAPMASFGDILGKLSPVLGLVPGIGSALSTVASTVSAFTSKSPQVGPAPSPVPPSLPAPSASGYRFGGNGTGGYTRPPLAGGGGGGLFPQAAGNLGNIATVAEQGWKAGRAIYDAWQNPETRSFSGRASMAGRAIKAIAGGDFFGAPATMAGTPTRALALARSGGGRMYPVANRHPALLAPFQDPDLGTFCPTGYRLRVTRDGSVRCLRVRRMNPLNPRALSRAGRRINGFMRAVSRYATLTRPKHGVKLKSKVFGCRKACKR